MRASLSAKVLGATLVVVVAALASGSALAFFTTTGTGQASASVSQVAAPSITSATAGVGGTVTLSWSAVTPPGPGAVTYTLTRDGEDPGGNCPKTPAQILTCVDTGVGVGTHSYVLTARWRSWSAESAPAPAEVTVGPVTHLDLEAASATPNAGATDNLTITARDANDATVTTYTGAKSLTFSGAGPSPSGQKPTVSNSSGTAIAFGSTTAITFTAGVASVTSSTKNGVMRLYKSGPTSIDVSDGTISSSPSLAVTVASLAATKITLGVSSTKPVAGEANNLTVTATDTYGNQAAAYTGPKSLTYSTATASPGGNSPTVSDSSGAELAFGTATTIAFDAGLASVENTANGVMKLYKSGSVSLKVSDGSLTSATVSATVSPAPAAQLTLAAASATSTAGAGNNLTTTALDPYGNTATDYTGAKTLTYSGASASPSGSLPTVVDSSKTAVSFGAPTAINFSSGVASVSSSKNGVMKIGLAGPASIVVSDGTISNATPLDVMVNPTSPSKLAYSGVSVSAGVLGSTCLSTCSVTGLGNSGTVLARVNVTDSFGNTVSDIGKKHAAKVTSSGGTISGGTLTFPSSGAAESSTQFTYTAKSSGNYSDTITAATSEGATYTSATFATSR